MIKPIDLTTAPTADGIRDCIHVAVVSCRVGPDSELQAGTPVRIENGVTVKSSYGYSHGIVSPWHIQTYHPGDLVWVVLTPGSITDLRHVWLHPEIPELAVTKGQNKLREIYECQFANQGSYGEFLNELIEHAQHGSCNGHNNQFYGDITPELWEAFTDATGITPKYSYTSAFTCSC